jgi:hypothetical protein
MPVWEYVWGIRNRIGKLKLRNSIYVAVGEDVGEYR